MTLGKQQCKPVPMTQHLMFFSCAKLLELFAKIYTTCMQHLMARFLRIVSRHLSHPHGPGKEENNTTKQSVLSVSQLIAFNYVKRSTKASTSHKLREKETPRPIYLSLKVHAETRKRGLVDMLYDLGLGIGYARLLTISADIANSVCKKFEETEVVVPTKMLIGVFTTAALDNIDHNPSSTTACDSLHGTSISLAQHRTSEENGEQPETLLIWTQHDADKSQLQGDNPKRSGTKKIPHLPLKYTNVLPVEPPVKEQFATNILTSQLLLNFVQCIL